MEKINKIIIFIKWLFVSTFGKRSVWTHLMEFPYIWILLLLLPCIAFVTPYSWTLTIILFVIVLAILTLLVLVRPMNAVYGLMGTSGSIRLFFFNFLFITFLFAKIYYWGFFQNAGISYDVNQPHIDYNLYVTNPKSSIEVLQSDTLIRKKQINNEWETEIIIQESKLNYQPISFWFTWRNTIITALMQEPTDFFSVASTYNTFMVDPHLSPNKQLKEIELDKQKAKMFQWVLIFQVLISWIFFGVFISLLYNKFRYES